MPEKRFSPPPAILQRVIGFKALKYKDGGLSIWGVPMFFNISYVEIIMQKYCLDKYGKEFENIIYSLAFFQGYNAIKSLTEKYGIANSLQDKKRLLEYNTGQMDLIGRGHFEWTRIDFNNGLFEARGTSPFAIEYRKMFGIQKDPIDLFLRGIAAGAISYLMKKPVLCIEDHCMACGKPSCHFIIKTLNKWDKKDPLYKKYNLSLIKEISEKRL